MKRIEFVSYDGEYPNLCSGKLTLKIDGKLYTTGQYDHVLISGGIAGVDFSDESHPREYRTKGPWEIDFDSLEEITGLKFCELERELLEDLINDSVPEGCCGGCI